MASAPAPPAPASGRSTHLREDQIKASLKELYGQERPNQLVAARLEDMLWDIVKKRYGRLNMSVEKRKWFEKELGVKSYALNARSGLLGAGDAANPVWHAISLGDLTLSVGYRVLTASKGKKDPARWVKKTVRQIVEGRRKPSDFRGEKKRKRRPRERPVAPVAPAPAPEHGIVADSVSSRELQDLVAQLARKFVTDRVPDSNDGTIEKIVEDFEYSVRLASDELLARVKAAQRQGEDRVRVTKMSEIRRAFEYLGLIAPRKLTEQARDEARRAYRLVALDLHPDKNNNDEKITEQFVEVNKAWATIRDAPVEKGK